MGDPREKYYGGPERVVMGDVRVTFGGRESNFWGT